jgi:hypothetical protein
MRIDIGDLSFTAPPGFTDVTGYSFKAPADKELCEVSGGALPPGVSDLDGLLAERRGELEDGLPSAIVIEGEGTTVLGGLPARTLTFSILDRNGRYRERWALALDTPGSYIQISYSAREDNAFAAERFEHVVASASFTPVALSTPDGYVRRWAGKLWLDIPAHLEPPRTYQFLSPDETNRLKIAFFAPAAEPTIERELAQDTALGEEVRERSSSEIATKELTGTLHVFKLARAQEGILFEDIVRRAHLLRQDVPVAHVYGRAPSADAIPLEALVDALIESVAAVERP